MYGPYRDEGTLDHHLFHLYYEGRSTPKGRSIFYLIFLLLFVIFITLTRFPDIIPPHSLIDSQTKSHPPVTVGENWDKRNIVYKI